MQLHVDGLATGGDLHLLERQADDVGDLADRLPPRGQDVVAPGIVASILVTFTVSFDEFVLAFFLSGNQPTLPVYIWSQIRFPAKLPNVLALGSILLLASVLMLVIAEYFRRRSSGKHF